MAKVAFSYWLSPRVSTTAGSRSSTSLAVAAMRQASAVPRPPRKLRLPGSQAMSPAAAITRVADRPRRTGGGWAAAPGGVATGPLLGAATSGAAAGVQAIATAATAAARPPAHSRRLRFVLMPGSGAGRIDGVAANDRRPGEGPAKAPWRPKHIGCLPAAVGWDSPCGQALAGRGHRDGLLRVNHEYPDPFFIHGNPDPVTKTPSRSRSSRTPSAAR